MVDAWVRAVRTGVTPPGTGFFGYEHMISVNPGETVLRSWVNWGGWNIDAPQPNFPPGGSLLRVGLAWVPFLEPNVPTPVSNPEADWMWITTLHPKEVQLSRATDVNWYMQWDPGIDQSVKSMRRNRTEDVYSLVLAWEFQLAGAVSGFELPYWNGSVDAYIRNPDASPLAVARTAPGPPQGAAAP